MPGDTRKHRWRFFRAGGFEQVKLDSGADLLSLAELDQKLWAALACPVDGIEFDRKTLELIDADGDGRIRAPDLIATLRWTGSVLKDSNTLVAGSAKLPLSAIADTAEGKRLLASAKQILKNLGKKDAAEISVDDTTDRERIFAETMFNGDGVVPPGSADDEDLRAAIRSIIEIVGGVRDRSGLDGVDRARLDELFAEAHSYTAWLQAGEADAARVMPLGDGTAAAADAFRAVKPKIDDYFTRVKLAAFDARAQAPLSPDPAEYAALSSRLLGDGLEEVAAFPLASIQPDRPLPLRAGLNPAWREAMARFEAAVVAPLLGERAELTEADHRALSDRLAPHEAWRAAKPAARVEALGEARVRAMIERGYQGKIAELIARDEALAPEAEAIASVDKLVRFHRDLHRFAESFVTFRDFYARGKATFQAGTLYIDGRSCDLCVVVADAAAHAAVAARSEAFLVYCDLQRKGDVQKMSVVAAITAGEADSLMVGRNGVFYDRKGRDWDATVTRIIENPISIRQAFWMPYKRMLRLIESQLEKLAASRDKDLHDRTAVTIVDVGGLVAAPPAPGAPATPPAPPAPAAAPAAAPRASDPTMDLARYAGVFAALALAVGALGTAFGAVVTGFVRLPAWQMPFVVAGLVLLLSGPSMLIAFMKLRRRNIAPMLDPSGWAVNAQAKLNIPFGASLTHTATLPPGAERSLDDPFEQRRRPWLLYSVVLLLAGACAYFWWTGDLPRWLRTLDTPPPSAQGAPSASAPAAPGP